MEQNRILLVIGINSYSIGGHILSAITLGKYLGRCGYQVDLFISPIPNLDEITKDTNINIIEDENGNGIREMFSRISNIYRVARKHGHNYIVAMDWYAALFAGLAVIRDKIPLVQVIAGGVGPPSDPLNLPGIVVFSEELINTIPNKYGIPPENLFLSPGRVDFESIKNYSDESPDRNDLGFDPNSGHILFISRLVPSKMHSVQALFEQLRLAARNRLVECVIIGDGPTREALEEDAKKCIIVTNNRIKISFLGERRVKPSDLRQADIVIGQGRSVLEAIACNVPAAVCGSEGYKGLLTSETFPKMAVTNLSGRNIKPFSSLVDDLARLDTFRENGLNDVYKFAYDRYDAHRGATTIVSALENVQKYYSTLKMGRITLFGIWAMAWLKGLINWLNRRMIK